MQINIKKLRDNATIPARGSASAAGYDLYACLNHRGGYTIQPNQTVKVNTGIAVEIPEGYFGAVFARSGLSTNKGLRPANCVGVIDSDYRGEIIVALHNDTNTKQTFADGERIAQLVIIPFLPVEFCEVDELGETARGTGGYGSTGTTSFAAQEPEYEQLSLFDD